MGYIKVRKIDNVIVDYQETTIPINAEYYYLVDNVENNMLPGRSYIYYRWNLDLEQIELNPNIKSVGYNGDEPIILKPYLIYDNVVKYDDEYEPPFDIDFTILKLYRIPTITNGDLSSVVYYKDVNIDKITGEKTFLNPAVRKDITYTRKDGYLSYRTTEIKWYFNDGTLDENNIKTVIKHYNPSEAIAAGVNRRKYGIDSVKILVAYLISQTESITPQEAEVIAFPYLAEITEEINCYLEGYIQPMVDKVSGSTTFIENEKYVYGTKVFKDNKCYKCNKLEFSGVWNNDDWSELFDFSWMTNVINQYGTTIRDAVVNELITFE